MMGGTACRAVQPCQASQVEHSKERARLHSWASVSEGGQALRWRWHSASFSVATTSRLSRSRRRSSPCQPLAHSTQQACSTCFMLPGGTEHASCWDVLAYRGTESGLNACCSAKKK